LSLVDGEDKSTTL